jgi:methylthioribose-1-phosphate isomerase
MRAIHLGTSNGGDHQRGGVRSKHNGAVMTPLVSPLPRTIDWHGDHAVIIDQTLLPGELRLLRIDTVDAMIDAIKRLAVRGAPAIGVAGALGVAISSQHADILGLGRDTVHVDADRLAVARPTAVNLSWGVNRMRPLIDRGTAALAAEARVIVDEDIATQRTLGHRGADLVAELTGAPKVRVHTHCNAGGLACVEWGTALGIVRALHETGRLASVMADETRPLLQGARLTAYELAAMGIDYRVTLDGAGPSAIRLGLVDCVIIGADRIAANGDVCNKVGSYPLALAAARAGIPFIVAAPESTVDAATPNGAAIEIEERSPDEVINYAGIRTAPEGANVWNPAFDVTPADLVTAIVTERRIIRPALGERVAP